MVEGTQAKIERWQRLVDEHRAELEAMHSPEGPIPPICHRSYEQGDKLTRAAKSSAQFEAGAVFFPKAAPWLSALKAELLGFPNVRYDDQVNSVTQALAWIEKRKPSYVPIVCPVIVRVHNPYRDAFPDYRDVPR